MTVTKSSDKLLDVQQELRTSVVLAAPSDAVAIAASITKLSNVVASAFLRSFQDIARRYKVKR